eukprot:scaffold310961_cov41-Prasinocladus_malaysianus.AAC.1
MEHVHICIHVSVQIAMITVRNNTKDLSEPWAAQGRVDDVEPEDLQLGKFLGAGAEGVVFAAWYNDSPVAVKKTNNVSEVQLHVLAGSHDNIVAARGVMLHEGELHLVSPTNKAQPKNKISFICI